MRQSRQENSSTRIQSVIRSFLHRRRFCRHLERKRDARARETEQLKRLAERSPRSWQRARTPDGKTYYYDMQTGCRAWHPPDNVNWGEQEQEKNEEKEEQEEEKLSPHRVIQFHRMSSPPGLANFRRPRDRDRVKRLKRCMTRILLSMSCLGDSKNWYFIDGDSMRHGPFETSQMAKWLFHPKQHVALNPKGPYAAVLDLFENAESEKVSFEWNVQSELRQADMLIRGHLNTIGEEMSEI